MSPELVVQLATLGTTGLLAFAMWLAKDQIKDLTTMVKDQQTAMMTLITMLVKERLSDEEIQAFRQQAMPPQK